MRFHAGLKNQIVLQANLLSLYREGGVDAAAAQADDMVRQGFIAVFDDLPSVPYRVIPRGVVPKAGTDELRGIADQGAPRKPLYTKPVQGHGQSAMQIPTLNDERFVGIFCQPLTVQGKTPKRIRNISEDTPPRAWSYLLKAHPGLFVSK